MKKECIIFLFCICKELANGATMEDADTLHATLKSGYNKYVRPVKNQSEPITVDIFMGAISIQEFDEILEKFSVFGAFLIQWTDERMIWNQSEYGGIESVEMGYMDVWVPELILFNPAKQLDSFGREWQLISYSYSGRSTWGAVDLIKSTCSLNVRYYPFDVQKCEIGLYAWGYPESKVRLNAPFDYIDTSSLSEHPSWTIISTKTTITSLHSGSMATFSFELKRKPQYIIINVLLPVLFLCLLNCLVFLLPAESGERISFAITVLLSIAVFMTIVSDTLPTHSDPVALYSYILMFNLILSAIITLVVILNLRMFHKENDEKVPVCLTSFYRALTCFRCKATSTKQTSHSDMENSLRHSINETRLNHGIKDSKGQGTQIFSTWSNNTLEKSDSTVIGNVNGSQDKEELNRISVRCDEAMKSVTWKDISVMMDYLAFAISFFLTVISFIIFIGLTRGQ